MYTNVGPPYPMVPSDRAGAVRVVPSLTLTGSEIRGRQRNTSAPKTARPGARFRQRKEVPLRPNSTQIRILGSNRTEISQIRIHARRTGRNQGTMGKYDPDMGGVGKGPRVGPDAPAFFSLTVRTLVLWCLVLWCFGALVLVFHFLGGGRTLIRP